MPSSTTDRSNRPFAKQLKDTVVQIAVHAVQLRVLNWFFENGLTSAINGVYRFGSDPVGSLAVAESDIPDEFLHVAIGAAIVDGVLTVNYSEAAAEVEIIDEARWDLLCIDSGGRLSIVVGSGEEDPDVGSLLAIFRIVHRAGETCVKLADDATNAYVEDVRVWVN